MKNWYEKEVSVLNYITTNYKKIYKKPLSNSLEFYLYNLGLKTMYLKYFVEKFNLQNATNEQLIEFVCNEKNAAAIKKYYVYLIYMGKTDIFDEESLRRDVDVYVRKGEVNTKTKKRKTFKRN